MEVKYVDDIELIYRGEKYKVCLKYMKLLNFYD